MRPPDHCAACDATYVAGTGTAGSGADYTVVKSSGALRWLVLAHPGTKDEHEALRTSTKKGALGWIRHVRGKLVGGRE